MRRLPPGWCATTLGELGEWSSGGTPSRKDPSNFGGSIPWVKTGDLDHQVIDKVEETISETGLATSSAKVFPSGTLLVAMYGATIGQTGVLTFDAATNQACAALITKGTTAEIIPYVWRYLISVQDDLKAIAQGGAQPNISQAILKDFPIWVPPLAEQRRIVAKIDSLSAKSKRARDHLDHIPRLVEKYKQAILAAAFRGELTREWRSKQPKLADWTTSAVGEVVAIASGQTPKGIETSLSSDGDVPWFKVSSMNAPENLDGLRSSQFRLSRREAVRLGLRIFQPGAIAFPKRGGAIATNKKRRLLVEGAVDLNLMVLTATGVAPEYLWWWMQKLDLASISNGSNVPQINNGDIASLPIEVPPVEEQHEIARRIETAFVWIDRLAAEATSARKLIDHLDQAILTKAFRGELVPQDPNDEPASVLLERIRAERQTAARQRGSARRASRSGSRLKE